MAVHVHVHAGRSRDAGTAHDPKSGQFTAGSTSSPTTRHEHAQQATWHRGEEKKHERAMYEHRNSGRVAAQRGSREMMHQHRKAAEHHERQSKEEMIPTGRNQRPIAKSKVNKATKALLGWR